MNINARLVKLEAAAAARSTAGPVDFSPAGIMAEIETALELPAGSLPQSPEEATRRGFQSLAAALAETLGLSMAELKEALA